MTTTGWVLIIFFKYGYAGGTSTAVFANRESCKAAAEWVNKDVNSWSSTAAAGCFPMDKGNWK